MLNVYWGILVAQDDRIAANEGQKKSNILGPVLLKKSQANRHASSLVDHPITDCDQIHGEHAPNAQREIFPLDRIQRPSADPGPGSMGRPHPPYQLGAFRIDPQHHH